MDDLQNVKNAIDEIVKIMAENEYSIATIKNHRGILNAFVRFMERNQHSKFTEEIGMAFIKERTGTTMEGFWGYCDRKTNRVMKPIQNLLFYLENGDLTFFIRSHIKPFVCPPAFEKEYYLFQKEYKERNYKDATIVCNNNIVHKLLLHMEEKGINSSNEITALHLTEFLALYSQAKPKYVSTILYVLRDYFTF